jgi:hypothetical protein
MINKFNQWVFRLSRWLCLGIKFCFVFPLVEHVPPLCNDHWHHHFLQPEHAVQATAQSSFLRCLWACNTYIFAVAISTTISCSLGRQYGPVLSLAFLDVYRYSITPLLQWPLAQLFSAAWAGSMGQCSV